MIKNITYPFNPSIYHIIDEATSLRCREVVCRLGYSKFEALLCDMAAMKMDGVSDVRQGITSYLTYVYFKPTGPLKIKIMPVAGEVAEVEAYD